MPHVAPLRPLALLVHAHDLRIDLGVVVEVGRQRGQRVLPEAVLLLVAAHRQPHLEDRVAGAHQHLGLATVSPSSSVALNVIQPANMWPCGVISVNDSSSA